MRTSNDSRDRTRPSRSVREIAREAHFRGAKQVRVIPAVVLALVLVPAMLTGGVSAMANKNKPVSAGETGTGETGAGETGEEAPGLRTGVVGTVRSPAGEPVSGAVIVARSLDTPTKAIPEIAIVTNESGSFAWPLRPGRYELAPMLDGRRGDFRPVSVAPRSVTRLDLVFQR